MSYLDSIFSRAADLLPTAAVTALVVVVLFVARRILDKGYARVTESGFRVQLVMIGLTLVGLLTVIMTLPISDAARGQLLSFLGILLSAVLALSSTTFISNALAGLMLRVIRSFRGGDFVRTEDHFGRVSERGLFHTEIQTEDRDLTTLPNLFLVTHPVTVVRSSGTIVSTTVSLGYDIPRKRVEALLLASAERTELEDPFVHLLELGDFSVTYRVAGLLTDVKQLLSARSRLRAHVLDGLHAGGVEIVSPTFMNTRAIAEGKRFIPAGASDSEGRPEEIAEGPEAVVFDKAEMAASVEDLRERHDALGKTLEKLDARLSETKDAGEREALTREKRRLEQKREALADIVKARRSGSKKR